MRKSRVFLGAAILLAAAAAPASANTYVPSFVQFLTSPVTWSTDPITFVLTAIPVIFVIAVIEALVLRRYTPDISMKWLIWYLAAVNAVTSVLGRFFMPTGMELWPNLLGAFAVTAAIEGLLLRVLNPGIPRGTPPRGFLRASLHMNAVSYAVLAVALAAMIYLPDLPHQDRTLAGSARGVVAIARSTAYTVADLETGVSSSERAPYLRAWHDGRYSPAAEPYVHAFTPDRAWRVRRGPTGWQAEAIDLGPAGGKLIALSPDGTLSLREMNGSQKVVESETGRTIRTLTHFRPQESGVLFAAFSFDNRFIAYSPGTIMEIATGEARRMADGVLRSLWRPDAPCVFNPERPVLAWEEDGRVSLYDCLSGRGTTLALPDLRGSPQVAWSPDGKLLAYFANVNRFTHDRDHSDLRVLDPDTGRTAAVCRHVPNAHYGVGVPWFWLPSR
jgi:hypothetical protein